MFQVIIFIAVILVFIKAFSIILYVEKQMKANRGNKRDKVRIYRR